MNTSEPLRPKFRLALLIDRPLISKYVVDFIKRVELHEALELTNVLLIASSLAANSSNREYVTSSAARSTRSPLANLLFGVVVAIEKMFLLKNERHHNHLRTFDVSAVVPNTIIRRLKDANDLQSIEALNLDLLITFSGIIPVHLHNAARLGIIGLSHSDEFVNATGPAGFWEVYFRRDVSGFSIERLGAQAGAKAVLLRGRVGTEFYYLLNQATLFEKSIYYLFKTTEKIATLGDVPLPQPNFPDYYIPRGAPNVLEAICYFFGLIHLTARKLMENARGYKFQWNVAFLRSDWRNAALWRASIIENPPQHFLADPFVISRGGKDFCFVEDIDNATKRGKIAVYSLGADRASYLGVALEENFHLSFPYLFEYQDELYMCPESSESREIRIYKSLDFPLRWRLEKIIMKNISAVDTILFERKGKWWMLTNTDPADWGDFSLELCIFSANSPLDEDWIPHPGNPFLIDASRTRNGGILREGDRVFRVAQAQGFDMYGKRTSINEILELNELAYAEQCVYEISPVFKKGGAGTHHLHSNGTFTILDIAHDGRILDIAHDGRAR
jgi:hypothetical protein